MIRTERVEPKGCPWLPELLLVLVFISGITSIRSSVRCTGLSPDDNHSICERGISTATTSSDIDIITVTSRSNQFSYTIVSIGRGCGGGMNRPVGENRTTFTAAE
jgi:hypothetical protein